MVPVVELNEKTHYIFQHLQNKGVGKAALFISSHKGFSLSFREGAIDSLEYDDAQTLSLQIFLGKKSASISTTNLSLHFLNKAIKKVLSLVKYVQEDQYAGLPERSALAFNYADLALYHPSTVSVQDITKQMAVSEQQIKRCSTSTVHINAESIQLSAHDGFIWHANTLDSFKAYYPYSQYSLSCQIIAKKKNDMQMDYDYTAARSMKGLESLDDLVKHTVRRTVKRLDARSAKAGSFPIIFQARAAISLWRHLLSAIEGMSIYRQMSFLQNALGKIIFPNFVTVEQKPHIIKGLHSAPFDGEGVLTRDLKYVENGQLINYVLSSYAARCLGLKTTGNAGGVYNISVSSGSDPLAVLCRQMSKGYLVTELLGQGVNLVTGDYSRGAFGYWVENGQIQYPVQELTIAGNLKQMFKQILCIGNDVTKYSNISTGSVLVEKMVVSATDACR